MNKFSALLFSVAFSLTAFASEKKPVVAPPPGWTCADKVSSKGDKYQICSPPAGQQGVPFFVWTREPKTK